MKSILYVGATLIIGAGIYGFVDYKQTHNKKEFKEMYENEKGIKPVEIINDKKTSSFEKNVPGQKQPVSDKKMVPAETRMIEKTRITSQVSNNSGVGKKIKKKRKFSTKLFSRGALDERYVNPKEKAELIKEDLKN